MPAANRPTHRRRLRGTLALVTAALTAVLLPGTWQTAHADPGQTRDIRPAAPGAPLTWGSNESGELGDGSIAPRSLAPGRVCGGAPCTSPLHDTIALSANGSHTLALQSDGTVLAWGSNLFGQLGIGTTTTSTTPARVCAPGATAPCTSFLNNVVAVAAGGGHSLALRADGTILAWGDNLYGELGNGTNGNSTTPVQVCAIGTCGAPLGNVVSIAAGFSHSLALLGNGLIVAWGDNANGQLGDGTTTNRNMPVITTSGDYGAIAAGFSHSLALRTDGTVYAWGDNTYGELGDGTNTERHTPTQVCAPSTCDSAKLSGIAAISAEGFHSVALRSEGTVRAWGSNGFGQLGDGTNTDANLPVRVCAPGATAPCGTFLTGISAVAGGYQHTLALRSDGGVHSWGANYAGQLGNGTTSNSNTPVRVCQVNSCADQLTGISAVAADNYSSLALSRSATGT
ncbi:RCC1-like domain-containing protein [Streptomyces kaniharaensis]|nr:RCC1 domain-containing protein [Streptomyces kaniharaensis]